MRPPAENRQAVVLWTPNPLSDLRSRPSQEKGESEMNDADFQESSTFPVVPPAVDPQGTGSEGRGTGGFPRNPKRTSMESMVCDDVPGVGSNPKAPRFDQDLELDSDPATPCVDVDFSAANENFWNAEPSGTVRFLSDSTTGAGTLPGVCNPAQQQGPSFQGHGSCFDDFSSRNGVFNSHNVDDGVFVDEGAYHVASPPATPIRESVTEDPACSLGYSKLKIYNVDGLRIEQLSDYEWVTFLSWLFCIFFFFWYISYFFTFICDAFF